MEIAFERLKTEEIDDELLREVLALYQTAFERWPYRDPGCPPLDHLRWKISSPASPWGMLVARPEGRVVAASCIRSCRVRVGKRSGLVLGHPDVAIHPDWQGRGLYRVAIRYMEGPLRAPHDLSLRDLGVHPAVAKIEPEIGREPANQVRTMLKVLDASGVLEDDAWSLEGARRLAGRLATPLLQRWGSVAGPSEAAATAIRRIEAFDERVDRLFEAAAAYFEVLIERTHAYLDWRYLSPGAGPSPCVCGRRVTSGWATWWCVRAEGAGRSETSS